MVFDQIVKHARRPHDAFMTGGGTGASARPVGVVHQDALRTTPNPAYSLHPRAPPRNSEGAGRRSASCPTAAGNQNGIGRIQLQHTISLHSAEVALPVNRATQLSPASNDGGYRWVAQWSPTDQTTAAQGIANHIRVPTATAHAIISQSKAANESASASMGYDVVVASGQTTQIRAGAPTQPFWVI